MFRGEEAQLLSLVLEATSDQEYQALLKSTLEYAAGNGKSILIVKLMKAMGVVRVPGVSKDVRDSIGDALRAAIRGGHVFILKMMLEHVGRNFDVNSKNESGQTILHDAARHGKARIMWLLSERGANLNALDDSGQTPLYMAVTKRRFGAVQAMLSQKVDLTIRYGIYDTSVVHLAAQSRSDDTRILRILLEHGADVNALDNRQQTALHFASGVAFSAETMLVLIRAGCDVNAKKISGYTPLMSAARHLKPVAVDILLRHGALEGLVGKNGKTAADVVGNRIKEEDRDEADVNRVRQLLESANIDRIWRRRAPLLLCRSRLTGVLQTLMKRRKCSMHNREKAEWKGVARWLLTEDTPAGIFRSVVTFLW